VSRTESSPGNLNRHPAALSSQRSSPILTFTVLCICLVSSNEADVTTSGEIMADIIVDDVGRTFCSKHRKARCNICCMDFEFMNEDAARHAGLRRSKTRAEELAEEQMVIERTIRGLKEMGKIPIRTKTCKI
jgi:hypothetical protein